VKKSVEETEHGSNFYHVRQSYIGDPAGKENGERVRAQNMKEVGVGTNGGD